MLPPAGQSNRTKTLKRQLQPQLNVAAGSRTDERIAGRDVGCGASAAENARGPHVILCTRATIVSRCAVRIRDEGVIEQIKELDAELGVVPFLEREIFEYGEIHVLEARVPEDVPAHGAIGSPLGRNHNRFTGHVAATVV